MKAKISESVLGEHIAGLSGTPMDDDQYAQYMAELDSLAIGSSGSQTDDLGDQQILELMSQGLSDAEILAALDTDGDNIDD